MKSYLVVTLFMGFLFLSCEGSGSDLDIVAMDNKVIAFVSPAFSFSKGKVTRTNDPNADFVVVNLINEGGGTIGVFLSGITPDTHFLLLESFETVDSADIYFDSLTTIPDVPFMGLALPVIPNQIWAVETHDQKFGKILILKTDYYNVDNTPYAKMTFKWDYQKNGTRYFYRKDQMSYAPPKSASNEVLP